MGFVEFAVGSVQFACVALLWLCTGRVVFEAVRRCVAVACSVSVVVFVMVGFVEFAVVVLCGLS